MKKALLSIATIALTASVSMADVHTLVFSGENDMYGLTRQTSAKADDLTFVNEWTFSEEGIDFAIEKTNEDGRGFALVNAGGNNSGIFIYGGIFGGKNTATKMSLTVPGGKITGLKMIMSGYALNSLSFNMNSTGIEAPEEVAASNDGNGIYSWTWSNPDGGESLWMEWPATYGVRYIRSLEVTYTRDLGGKKECGLEFSEVSADAVMGEEFTVPTLSNPNNLPLVWVSSDEKVATVDAQGKVTLVGGGVTTITVSTEGNDTFGAGNAKYELTVIPVANNLAKMAQDAPEYGNRVKVACPLTVTFANGNLAYVIDAEGNAGCVEDRRNEDSTSSTGLGTIYKVGDIMEAGWIASNDNTYTEIVWKGLPQKSEETAEVTYPRVEEITPADAFRVLTLVNVTFTKKTPSGDSKGNGTTKNGTSVEIQNTYDLPMMDPGTYDVTGVVRYAKKGETTFFYIAPIAYEESKPSGIDSIGVSGEAARYFNIQGVEVENPANGIYLKEVNGKVEKVIVK